VRKDAPDLSHFTFAYKKRVHWAEVDPQWVVFNANYLAFADIAFTEYLRALGLGFPNPVSEDGSEIFAVGSEVNWRRPARFDDLLVLKVRVARFGRSSFTAEVVMLRGDELLCDVRTTYANAAPDGSRSLPLPDRFVAAVDRFERVRPER
jgi:acyl-CoA thioester hydrolase